MLVCISVNVRFIYSWPTVFVLFFLGNKYKVASDIMYVIM